jgi:hypothetical protein
MRIVGKKKPYGYEFEYSTDRISTIFDISSEEFDVFTNIKYFESDCNFFEFSKDFFVTADDPNAMTMFYDDARFEFSSESFSAMQSLILSGNAYGEIEEEDEEIEPKIIVSELADHNTYRISVYMGKDRFNLFMKKNDAKRLIESDTEEFSFYTGADIPMDNVRLEKNKISLYFAKIFYNGALGEIKLALAEVVKHD